MRHHLLRFWIIITLIATACQTAPAPAVTRLPSEGTQTASAVPATPSIACPSQTGSQPTLAALPSTPAAVTSDGLVQGRVLPSPYLVPTQLHAPIAWTRSTGKGITVAVAQNHEEDLALVRLIAPDAQVELLVIDSQLVVDGQPLLEVLQARQIHLFAIPDPEDFDEQVLLDKVPALIRAGITVFLNGDLGIGADGRALTNSLEAAGAITVGRLKYGERILGRDVFQRHINLFSGYGEEGQSSDKNAVLAVAAVGALALSVAAESEFRPAALKQRLIDTADQMYTTVNPANNMNSGAAMQIDPLSGEFSPTAASYRLRRVNAANAVGARLAEPWHLNAMNVPAAWKTATGKGVLVGILDGGFHDKNALIQAHTVMKYPEQYFTEPFFHGTLVARTVLSVAPDVSLALLTDKEDGDLEREAKTDVQLIDYAIQHGVQVLTTSNKAWTNTPEVNAAIDRAIEAGMVVIHSDYTGSNPAVIRPGHWRFPGWEVGTLTAFPDLNRPIELEGGLSFAPPQIAGIAALILQNEPDLTPMEVKQRILQTATVLPNGNSFADAAAAVENRPSGRRLETKNAPMGQDGQLRVEFQLPDTEEHAVIEVQEAHKNWPVAALPPQDILFFRALPSTPGPYAGVSRLVAYRGTDLAMKIEWQGIELAEDRMAVLSVYPQGEWQPFYTVRLGAEGIPALHVEVICDRIHVSWNSGEGALMERGDYWETSTNPSDARLFGLELETAIMPDLLEPVY